MRAWFREVLGSIGSGLGGENFLEVGLVVRTVVYRKCWFDSRDGI